MNSEYLKGFILTAIGVLLLSFDALLIRLIDAEGAQVIFWRGIALSIVIAIGCKVKNPSQPLFSFSWSYFRSAILFATSSIAFVLAISTTSVANVLVIISIQPLAAALLSRIFLGEKSPLITWIAICICMLGVYWVVKSSWQQPNLIGDLSALVCGLALSSKFVNDRAASDRNMVPALILGGLLTTPFAYFYADHLLLQGMQWFWLSLLCVVIVPLAFILITLGPRRIPAAEVGMLMLLETVTGPIWVWFFLDEIPNSAALQGGTVVLGTLFLHGLIRFYSQRKRNYSAISAR